MDSEIKAEFEKVDFKLDRLETRLNQILLGIIGTLVTYAFMVGGALIAFVLKK